MLRKSCLFSLIAGFAFTGTTMLAPRVARADLASFAYNNLTGQYVTAGSHFTALSQTGVLSQSTDVTVARLVPVTGTAGIEFNVPHGVATFGIDMTLSGVTTATASALGTILIQDVDGDKFTASFNGFWAKSGSSAGFVGELSNVLAISSGNGTFNGTSGSGFSMGFIQPQPYTGNVITLVFQGWFTDGSGILQGFDRKTTNGSGTITTVAIPEPAGVVLGLIGMTPLVWRRRMA